MKKVPIYKQHDSMDCGPTCIKMIAAFHGKDISINKLKDLCYISREGVSLLGISTAAEKVGFHSIGVQIPISVLTKDIQLPCIIFWNQKHFVVLYKIKKYRNILYFYIADPMSGYIKYTQEEFSNCWINNNDQFEGLGIALVIEPTPQFLLQEDENSTNKKKFTILLSYLSPYKKIIIQLFIGLITGSILLLILPFLTQSIVDYGIINKNINFIYTILLAQLILTISKSSVEFIRGWILLHIGTRVNISLISDYLTKLMNLPIAYFDSKNTGDIMQRINDQSRIQIFLTNSSLSTLFSIFNIIILSIVILIYNIKIFFIFLFGSFLYILWTSFFMKKRAEIDNKSFAQNSANQNSLIQLIAGMQEIKLNTCEQQQRWDWEYIQAKIFKLRIKGLTISQYQESGSILINEIKNIIITAMVASMVIKEEITLGAMLSIQYIIGQLNSPIDQLIYFMRQYQDAKLSLDRLQEMYKKEDEIKTYKTYTNKIPEAADITIKNLTFSYNPLQINPTLKNISFTIPKRKKTAIVGISGSGKTTLIKLLLGFYTPNSGEILLGNCNINTFNIREWRKSCGVVMQDGFIYSNTIAYNIAPGEEYINKQKLNHAAEIANIKDYIESLPLSYNTKIGSDGNGLSQGQKQRILIARAVYKNPNFIFLDEATNALDANNEKDITNNLNKFLKDKTSIIVAHRLSTVKNADQIIVINHGEIAEIGSHDELIELKGTYFNLIKNQLNI